MNKEESLMVKGAAIVLMLLHHLFYSADVVDSYSGGLGVSYAPFDSIDVYAIFQSFKVCVAAFVFITAYGIAEKETSSDSCMSPIQTIRRFVKLEANFIFVFCIAQVAGLLLGGQGGHSALTVYVDNGIFHGIFYFVIDALGLASAFGTPTFNVTWWYMSYAILLVFLVPLLIKISRSIGDLALVMLSVFVPLMSGQDFTLPIWWWMPTVALGICCSHLRVFNQFHKRLHPFTRFLNIIFNLIFLVLLLVFRSKFGYLYIADALFAFGLCALMCQISNIPILAGGLRSLGFHSMNIFLIHSFIFKYFFSGIIYSFGHFLLVFAALLLSSMACSLLIERIKCLIKFQRLLARLTSSN